MTLTHVLAIPFFFRVRGVHFGAFLVRFVSSKAKRGLQAAVSLPMAFFCNDFVNGKATPRQAHRAPREATLIAIIINLNHVRALLWALAGIAWVGLLHNSLQSHYKHYKADPC